ncbi:hypothetical protein CPB84DRAFT_1843379 [Gymnopilus junonius]|uniref:Uncharacterized protein n=1 Tax=Gymnopilus junonius TaxID=109634 RepID=A0A9P5NWG7_GYMJU|nr:hypothetical protein CPB84DRAFT_1843379 [Gymnopilus junonius]
MTLALLRFLDDAPSTTADFSGYSIITAVNVLVIAGTLIISAVPFGEPSMPLVHVPRVGDTDLDDDRIEEDKDDVDEVLAISTLELLPPLPMATLTSIDWEHHDKHQGYETRYHLIYPPQLYNIPTKCHSQPPPLEFSSPTSHVLHLPPLGDNIPTTDSLPLDPLQPPSPLDFSSCHLTEHEPTETAHPQRACGGKLPSLLSPLDRPPSPSPPTSVSSSLAWQASAILSPAVTPLPSSDPQ